MCRIATQPPQIFIASPAQAPIGWLLFVSLIVGVVVTISFPRIRNQIAGNIRYFIVGLFVLSLLCVSCTVFLGLVIYFPFQDAISKWYGAQAHKLLGNGCSLDQLDHLHDAASQLAQPLYTVAQLFAVGGAMVFALVLYLTWRSQRNPNNRHDNYAQY